MLITVTNTSNVTLNDLDSYSLGTGVSGGSAVGGAKKYPLPYPFGHIGALAALGTKQLPMRQRDWTYKAVPWLPMVPAEEWQTMVQAGQVTLAIAVEVILAATRDSEERYVVASV